MGMYGNKATFIEGKANPKRTASKKRREFGLGFIGTDIKETVDAFCQSKDPLFGIKGKERHLKAKKFK